VGLDTLKFIIDGWHTSGEGLQGKEIVSPSKLVNDLVAKGKLGRKSGAGFYDYQKK
jgi:3-hydroxyacyl-CoA dehydrogenase